MVGWWWWWWWDFRLWDTESWSVPLFLHFHRYGPCRDDFGNIHQSQKMHLFSKDDHHRHANMQLNTRNFSFFSSPRIDTLFIRGEWRNIVIVRNIAWNTWHFYLIFVSGASTMMHFTFEESGTTFHSKVLPSHPFHDRQTGWDAQKGNFYSKGGLEKQKVMRWGVCSSLAWHPNPDRTQNTLKNCIKNCEAIPTKTNVYRKEYSALKI